MTKVTEDASPTVTRRYVLMGGAALAAIAVAGGAGYYLWTQPDTAVAQPAAGGGEVPVGELMTPAPSAIRPRARPMLRSRSSNMPR
jgi:hypothetical protein